MPESSLIDRFCRYARVDTQANPDSKTSPSSPGQLELGRLLVGELREMGLRDAAADEHGIVTATVPATAPRPAPTVALVAHMDTSPDASGKDVKPTVHRNYDGKDIVLPGDPTKVIRPADSPALARLVGGTIITSDGTTLLGSDDKSGVTILMETAAHLLARPQIPHGPVRLCFTCDEEIGRGVDHLEPSVLGADVAYTLDGEGVGEIDCETFSADEAVVTLTGVGTHPGWAKGKMLNAIRLAAQFVSRLPWLTMSPETTDGRQGFLHPHRIEGSGPRATVKILLRDFDTAKLAEQAKLLRHIAATLKAEHPRAEIDVAIRPTYRNMVEGLSREPRAVAYAEEAMRRAGLQPKRTIIRGGTDGSRLTEKGLPTPNLSSGQHNLHSPLEWTSVEEMATAMRVAVELVQVWAGPVPSPGTPGEG